MQSCLDTLRAIGFEMLHGHHGQHTIRLAANAQRRVGPEWLQIARRVIARQVDKVKGVFVDEYGGIKPDKVAVAVGFVVWHMIEYRVPYPFWDGVDIDLFVGERFLPDWNLHTAFHFIHNEHRPVFPLHIWTIDHVRFASEGLSVIVFDAILLIDFIEHLPKDQGKQLLDRCHDQEVARLAVLRIVLRGEDKAGARNLRTLGLIVPQLGKGEFEIEQSYNAEFGNGQYISSKVALNWELYRRLKQVTDALAGEAVKFVATTTLTLSFPEGLEVQGDQFRTLHEVMTTVGLDKIEVEGEPMESSG